MITSQISRLLVLFVALFFASPAFAESAESAMKVRQQELTTLISSNAPTEKLNQAFDQLLDYDKLASASLDGSWDGLTDAQKKEFQGLLVTLVQRAYTKNIRDTLNYSIEFRGESEAKAGRLVKTVAKHKTDQRKEPISIDYVVAQKDGKWRIQDIVTEGSSLVANYRSQFRKIIDSKGFPELIERMKKKAAPETTSAASP